MKHVPAIPKCNTQSIIIRGRRIRLIFDAGFVEGITTYGAGVGANVPGPHGDGVPFFDFEAGWCFFGWRFLCGGGGGGGGFGVFGCCCGGGIGHFDIFGFLFDGWHGGGGGGVFVVFDASLKLINTILIQEGRERSLLRYGDIERETLADCTIMSSGGGGGWRIVP